MHLFGAFTQLKASVHMHAMPVEYDVPEALRNSSVADEATVSATIVHHRRDREGSLVCGEARHPAVSSRAARPPLFARCQLASS